METACIVAHNYSMNHKKQVEKDSICGCFYCLKLFNPKEIMTWIPDKSGTAVCPYCGVDAILGESSGYPITTDFLKKMKNDWFADD